MENILPNRKEYHLILDDRRDVWGNSKSWYFTKEYYYFVKKQKKDRVAEVDHLLSN